MEIFIKILKLLLFIVLAPLMALVMILSIFIDSWLKLLDI